MLTVYNPSLCACITVALSPFGYKFTFLTMILYVYPQKFGVSSHSVSGSDDDGEMVPPPLHWRCCRCHRPHHCQCYHHLVVATASPLLSLLLPRHCRCCRCLAVVVVAAAYIYVIYMLMLYIYYI